MTDRYGRERQAEVYMTGTLTGETPTVPPRYADLRERASEALSPEAFAYVAGSAGTERTARGNRDAFDRWRIVPRPGRDVEERDLSVELLGEAWPAPVSQGYLPFLDAEGVVNYFEDPPVREALEALPEVVDAVLLGRPYVYGLALDGTDGVREVCRNLLADLDLTMALAGQASVSELDRSVLSER